MPKPIVIYKKAEQVRKGFPAYVVPIDHPSDLVSNTTWAMTSRVIRVGADGEFETENTIYRHVSDSVEYRGYEK